MQETRVQRALDDMEAGAYTRQNFGSMQALIVGYVRWFKCVPTTWQAVSASALPSGRPGGCS
jgi:hypothetical protein